MAEPVLGWTRAAPAPSPAARQLDDRIFLLCGLAWGAGLIHWEAAIEHLQEHALFAVFFAFLAATQCLWGIAVYRSPARGLLRAGAVMSLMVVALWIVSRTSGLPIGPDHWTPERVGALDSVATGDEVVLALLVLFQLRSGAAGALERGGRHLATAAALTLILLSSLSLIAGGPAH